MRGKYHISAKEIKVLSLDVISLLVSVFRSETKVDQSNLGERLDGVKLVSDHDVVELEVVVNVA